MREQVLAGLETLRPSLTADGADIELISCEDGVVQLRLVFGPDTCQECILERSTLELLFQDALEDHLQPLRQVRIEDPREASVDS